MFSYLSEMEDLGAGAPVKSETLFPPRQGYADETEDFCRASQEVVWQYKERLPVAKNCSDLPPCEEPWTKASQA